MFDCQLFGLNSGAHHCVNLALHVVNVLFLFTLLRLGTGAVWRSFMVAILFSVHPLNVETVAWVAERKSLLSFLFSLLTITAYGWYIQRPGWKRYLGILAAFSLALMSKPMAVTLPVVLLLLDYWPLNREAELPYPQRWLRLLTEKIPLFLMSAASSCLTMAAVRAEAALTPVAALPLRLRMVYVTHSYITYIGKLFWPAKLAVLYPSTAESVASLPAVEIILSSAFLAGLTAAVLYFRRARYLAMGWFLFLITLVPVIGIVQFNQVAIADRFTYIPFIGLFIILVWGCSSIADKASMNVGLRALVSLCLIVPLTIASSHNLQYWKNEVTLFTQARKVAVQPNFLIEGALADGLMAAGRTDEALEHYQQACTLDSRDPLCHYNIARILFIRNDFEKAIDECHMAARLAGARTMSVSVGCFLQSGVVMMNFGRFDAAEKEFEAALAIDPGDQRALRFREENLRRKNGGNR